MTTTHRLCTVGIASSLSLILLPGAIWAQGTAPAPPPAYPDPNQTQYPPPQQQQQQPGQAQPYPQQYPPQSQPYPQQGYPPQYPQAQQPYPQQQGYPQQYPPQPQPQPYPQPGYPQPGYPQPYPGPYQTPPPPQGHHGLLLAGFLGIHAFQGDTGEGLSPGLRLGGLLGFYASPVFSLNGELALDFLNYDNSALNSGATAARVVLAFSPLYHVPTGQVELVVGPKIGFWGTSISFDNSDASASFAGYLLGLNAGLFARVGNVSLGGLVSFEAGYPTRICSDDGTGEICGDPIGAQKDADKVLAVTGAILF
ncbi:MAG TPA: hypothetical protein VFH68_18465 [Polyangia bacterium]|jgi:hypothetical protein|nr:hypothetical protein [Polyangia bacterium]